MKKKLALIDKIVLKVFQLDYLKNLILQNKLSTILKLLF